jgi:hypothetical protein
VCFHPSRWHPNPIERILVGSGKIGSKKQARFRPSKLAARKGMAEILLTRSCVSRRTCWVCKGSVNGWQVGSRLSRAKRGGSSSPPTHFPHARQAVSY